MFGRRIFLKLFERLKEFGPVKGPLEIWPYPVINLAFKVLKAFKEVK